MPKLSILILTIPERRQCYFELLGELMTQCMDKDVEILTNFNSGTIGSKRQQLLLKAQGEYVCFVDDDDEIANNYIDIILESLITNPDCIGMTGTVSTNGRQPKSWVISRSFTDWHEKDGVYYRHTNHLAPVKRSIALQAGFSDKSYAEDYEYSMKLVGLLKTEVQIQQPIYHYKYVKK